MTTSQVWMLDQLWIKKSAVEWEEQYIIPQITSVYFLIYFIWEDIKIGYTVIINVGAMICYVLSVQQQCHGEHSQQNYCNNVRKFIHLMNSLDGFLRVSTYGHGPLDYVVTGSFGQRACVSHWCETQWSAHLMRDSGITRCADLSPLLNTLLSVSVFSTRQMYMPSCLLKCHCYVKIL